MLRTTLTAAWSRKRRLVGTALAIVLGIGFLTATLVLGDSARSGFEVAFTEANAGTDAIVRSEARLTGGESTTGTPIDAALLDAVAAVDGVAAVAPSIEGFGQLLDADGDPIGGDGPPTIAANWVEDPGLTGWDLAEGRAPAAAGEVVIDRGSADAAEVAVGDPVTVLLPEAVDQTVVGIATFGDDDSIGGSTLVAFTTEEAQRLLLGSTDRLTAVVVAADDGVTQAELVGRLDGTLPGGLDVLTGEALTAEMEDDIEGDFLGALTTALLAFALVALLVAGFSIFNTFSILVAQRTRESALLRALGASRRQVLGAALLESAIVGLVGAAFGVLAGIGLAAGMLSLMEGAGFGLPTDGLALTGSTAVTAVLVGLGVTVLGGLVPAWKSSRVAPLAALRDVAIDHSGSSRIRAALGVLASAGGAATVLLATRAEEGGGIGAAGLGAVALFVGVVLLGPIVVPTVGRVLGAPLGLKGVTGDLARRNAIRNPRRTSGTAAALLVGVGVVTLFTVFGASVSQSIGDEVDRSFGGDLVLSPRGSGFSGAGVSTDVQTRLAALPEVGAVAGVGFGPATVDGEQEEVDFADASAIAAILTFEPVAGDLTDVGDDEVAMSAEYADAGGWQVGDAVEVGFVDGATETLTLGAVFEDQALGGSIVVPLGVWEAHNTQPSFFAVFVDLADGVELAEGRAAVEAALPEAGTPDVQDREEWIDAQAAEIDVLLTIIYGLLFIAIVIALMGIANTLSLSVHERTRELGLLRAVGQTRSQLRSMVRWESVVVAAFGSVGGLALGTFLGWGLVRTLNASEGFGTFALPVGSLLWVLAIGAIAGVLAGLRPAWRASRLDVLAAVSAD
jgi:putative ABC transport system permease protein